MAKNITIIGGGPAGIMAAITAAKRGHSVVLYEKNNQLGKKLALTGGGRCNLTNTGDPEDHIRNVVNNASFLYGALYTFGSTQLMDFFEQLGLPLKVEQQRVFPKSDCSGDIVKALKVALVQHNVKVLLNSPITDIQPVLDKSDAVIVATGGCSYPGTGSTGDGYRWARTLGHNVTDLRPALVPMYAKTIHENIPSLAGLSLNSVGFTLTRAGKDIFKETGELLFTHKGISGPLALKASSYLTSSYKDITAAIDLKPDLSFDKLDDEMLDTLNKHPNKSLENILNMFFPKRLIPLLLAPLSLNTTETKANALTKKERIIVLQTIKNLIFKVTGTAGFKEAVITAGGVDVREVNPSNMSSKKVPKLYFVGEILDVDAYTGGFNLQIAFSTGFVAGSSI